MEEQNKTPHRAEDSAQKNNHNRRHRPHHRGGKRSTGAGNAAEPAVTVAADAKQAGSGNSENAAQTGHTGGNRNNAKNNNHHNKKHKGGSNQKSQAADTSREDSNERQKSGSRHDSKKRRNNRSGNYSGRGLVDLYGNPTEDDVLTMEELRAKIVLNASDGLPSAKETKPLLQEPDEPIEELPFDVLFPGEENPAQAPDGAERVEVIGVRFRSAGKVYYFDPKGHKVRHGDCVIVETARGPEFGEISFGNRMVNKTATVSPLRPLLRVATEEDIAHNAENRQKEAEALEICRQKVAAHKLQMKLLDVQYAFDNSKLLFYFTSEGRVDFRDLVKDLASVFRTRIELRQIGIRDEAKMLGGLGACGRTLCCATFLSDFVQVSIKMAKEQGLSLNSAKISGVCGRLMCCLRYEADVYAEELKKLPSHDAAVKTPDGIGNVLSVNPLAGTVRVIFKNTETPPKQYPASEITVLPREKRAPDGQKNAASSATDDEADEQKTE